MLKERRGRVAVHLTVELAAALACALLSGKLAHTAELGSDAYPYPLVTSLQLLDDRAR